MTDLIVLSKALAASKVNVRGTGKLEHASPREAEEADRTPNWDYWRWIPSVEPWEAAALWSDIDPRKLRAHPDSWMVGHTVFMEGQEFKDRLGLVEANLYGALKPPVRPYGKVDLRQLAAWVPRTRCRPPAGLLALAGEGAAPELPALAPANIFRAMPGLQWSEVSITFIDPEAVRIHARGENRTFTYEAMGFKNEQSRMAKPNKVWETLKTLAIVANTDKTLSHVVPPQTDFKRRVSRLRDLLQEFFWIKDDPILYGAGGYRPAFVLAAEEQVIRHAHDQVALDDEDEEDVEGPPGW